MKPLHLAYLLPLILILPACSSSDPLSYLKGSYELATGCVLKVSKSSASASCDTSTVKAAVNVTISEESIKIEQLSWTTKESNTTCYDARECTTVYTGSASKGGAGGSSDGGVGPMAGDGFSIPMGDTGGGAPDQGAPAKADAGGGSSSKEKGIFTGLVGKWSGEIKAAISCATETIKSGAPKSCTATPAETITYGFDATATDHEIAVDWYGTPKAGKGTFKIVETKTGVRAGSNFYKRTSGGSSPPQKKDTGAAASDGA